MRRTAVVVLVVALMVGGAGIGLWRHVTAPAGVAEAVELADVQLPSRLTEATVLAVGEATHGTAEFREAWTTIALKAAEEGFTTIALEESAGPVSQVDAWVQGGPGSAEEAAGRFGFALNRTRQMADFLTALRKWNAAHPEDPVRLHGLDVQRAVPDREVALEWLRGKDPKAAARLAPRLDAITRDTAWEQDQARAMLEPARQLAAAVERAAQGAGDDASLRARLSARTLVQGMERGSEGIDSWDRDAALHQNLRFLVEQRAGAGGRHTLLLAHNGHVDRSGAATMAPGSKLGVLNHQHWGDDYRVVGADAHRVRLQDDGSVHSFTVGSPVRGIFAGTRIGFVDFAEVAPANRAVLQEQHPMASAGSPFAAWQAWLPPMHQIGVVPATSWDALVYVTDSHPTDPLEG
ncbi:erythromycin esterase family protein [Luteococcus sp.]|uniref:erythromycin esterase family protein n=1 Tax=Luteococcus sp. TaxID=1969402 RepID=UPI0037352552